MIITGHDTVIFSWTPPSDFVSSLVLKIETLWPELIIDIELMDSNKRFTGVRSGSECVQLICEERHPIMLFLRDLEMRQHLDNHGYTIDSKKEGPFAVHLRKRQNIAFALANVIEVSNSEKTVGTVDPYPAWLCSFDVLEVTLVSPGDPEYDEFSKKILNCILESLIKKR